MPRSPRPGGWTAGASSFVVPERRWRTTPVGQRVASNAGRRVAAVETAAPSQPEKRLRRGSARIGRSSAAARAVFRPHTSSATRYWTRRPGPRGSAPAAEESLSKPLAGGPGPRAAARTAPADTSTSDQSRSPASACTGVATQQGRWLSCGRREGTRDRAQSQGTKTWLRCRHKDRGPSRKGVNCATPAHKGRASGRPETLFGSLARGAGGLRHASRWHGPHTAFE